MFKLVKGPAVTQKMYCGASSALTEGAVACFDVSTGANVSPVIDATAALLSVNLAGVVKSTPAAADTYVDVIVPVTGQIWEYDCTSLPTIAMLGKKNDLTDSKTVANSTTISTAATAFVLNLEIVSTSSPYKMRGLLLGAQLPKALT